MTSRSTARTRPRLAATVAIALAGVVVAGCAGGETPDGSPSTGAGSGSPTREHDPRRDLVVALGQRVGHVRSVTLR